MKPQSEKPNKQSQWIRRSSVADLAAEERSGSFSVVFTPSKSPRNNSTSSSYDGHRLTPLTSVQSSPEQLTQHQKSDDELKQLQATKLKYIHLAANYQAAAVLDSLLSFEQNQEELNSFEQIIHDKLFETWVDEYAASSCAECIEGFSRQNASSSSQFEDGQSHKQELETIISRVSEQILLASKQALFDGDETKLSASESPNNHSGGLTNFKTLLSERLITPRSNQVKKKARGSQKKSSTAVIVPTASIAPNLQPIREKIWRLTFEKYLQGKSNEKFIPYFRDFIDKFFVYLDHYCWSRLFLTNRKKRGRTNNSRRGIANALAFEIPALKNEIEELYLWASSKQEARTTISEDLAVLNDNANQKRKVIKKFLQIALPRTPRNSTAVSWGRVRKSSGDSQHSLSAFNERKSSCDDNQTTLKLLRAGTELSTPINDNKDTIAHVIFQKANNDKGEECLWVFLSYLAVTEKWFLLLNKNHEEKTAFDVSLSRTENLSEGKCKANNKQPGITAKLLQRACNKHFKLLKTQLAFGYVQQAFARLLSYIDKEMASEVKDSESFKILERDKQRLNKLIANISHGESVSLNFLRQQLLEQGIGKCHRRRIYVGATKRRSILQAIDLTYLSDKLTGIKSLNVEQIKDELRKLNGGHYSSILADFDKLADQSETELHKRVRLAIDQVDPNKFTQYVNGFPKGNALLGAQQTSPNAQGYIPLQYIHILEQSIEEKIKYYQDTLVKVTEKFSKVLFYLHDEQVKNQSNSDRLDILDKQLKLIKKTIHDIAIMAVDSKKPSDEAPHLEPALRRRSSSFGEENGNIDPNVCRSHLNQICTDNASLIKSSQGCGFFRKPRLHTLLVELKQKFGEPAEDNSMSAS